MNQQKKLNGFTLIEPLAVVAIIAITTNVCITVNEILFPN